MRSLRLIYREWLTTTLWLGLALAGLATEFAAHYIPYELTSPLKRIHFALYSLGGHILMALVLTLIGAVIVRIAGLFMKDDRPETIRRWILSVAIGLGLLLILPRTFIGNLQVLSRIPSIGLITSVLLLPGFIAGAILATAMLEFLKRLTERGRWSVMWGFWAVAVVVPIIYHTASGLMGGGTQARAILLGLTGLISLIIIILLTPRLYDWVNKGSVYRRLAAVAILVVIYFATWPVKAGLPEGEPSGPDAPPIVYISIDTLRSDALGCYPQNEIPLLGTPNIDRIAEEGIAFENAYATSSWTVPSVGSYLSGLPPSAHRSLNSKSGVMTSSTTTLAEVLGEAGYVTAGFVHNGVLGPGTGMEQGFDRYEEMKTIHRFSRQLLFQKAGDRLRLMIARLYTNIKNTQDVMAANRAAVFIEENADRRFFVWLHLFAPHATYDPPAKYKQLIRNELGLEFTGRDLAGNRHLDVGTDPITRDRLELIRALYAAEVVYADDTVGTVIDTLERLEILDDCILIIFSDHGEEFFEHDRAQHAHCLYPEVVHVPLIVRYPGRIPGGERIDDYVSLIDLPPTVLDLAGVESIFQDEPAMFTGRSLVPMMIGGDYEAAPVFIEASLFFDRDVKSVIYDGLYYFGGRDAVFYPRLFDLSSDPATRYNILRERPDDAEMLAEMIYEYEELCDLLRESLGEPEAYDRSEIFRSLGYMN